MSIGDIIYIIVAILFSIMTFAIVRGNFQRKFDEDGNRIEVDKSE
jgi:uncharacterized ion transporter superfamily protein YfcC